MKNIKDKGKNRPRFNKNKGKKNVSEDKFSKGDRSVSDNPRHRNDPAWYNRFPELTSVATKVSWQIMHGAPFEVDKYTFEPGMGFTPTKDIGVAAMGFIPCPGVGEHLYDPVNKAALEMWSALRRDKSGTPGYDPADITKVCVAMDSIYTYIAAMVRLYGTLNIASNVNAYIPKTLVEAQCVNFEDAISHKAELLMFINTFVVQCAKINVPAGLTMVDRHVFLANNVFKDEDIDRASLFMYVPHILWKYNETGGDLVPVDFQRNHHTAETRWLIDDLMSMGWDLLNAVERVEDFYTMNANILTAYGDNLHRLASIDTMYSTIPVYREEMLIQLHNMVFVGANYDTESMRIWENVDISSQDKGALVFKPTFHMYNPAPAFDQILDIPFPNPSEDDIMEATRWKVIGTGTMSEPTTDPGRCTITLNSAGTEIAVDMWIHFNEMDTDGSKRTWTSKSLSVISASGLGDYAYARYLTKFNMSPVYIEFAIVASGGENFIYPKYVLGDITNSAVVTYNNIINMHMAALFSELNVPSGVLLR